MNEWVAFGGAIIGGGIGAAIISGIFNNINNKTIERLKDDLQKSSKKEERVSETQFKLYNDLWVSISDLYIYVEKLFKKIEISDLADFAKTIIEVRKSIEHGRLFLSKKEYDGLSEILNAFEEYKIGKDLLIRKYASGTVIPRISLQEQSAIWQIIQNKRKFSEIKNLKNSILKRFKKKLEINNG